MNVPKKEITEFLEQLKETLAPIEETESQLAKARSDAADFEQTIGRLGEPEYDDDEAIQKLTVAKTRLNLCRGKIDRLERQFAGSVQGISECLAKGGELAANTLLRSHEMIIESAAAALLPFSLSEDNARTLARSTDAAQAAVSRMHSLRYVSLGATDAIGAVSAAKTISSVLAEALKPKPEMEQFLTFVAASK